MKFPLFKQKKNTCGATALRMIFSFYGVVFSEKDIIKVAGGLKRYGLKTIDLRVAAERFGFKTICFSYNQKMAQNTATIKKPKMNDVVRFLKKGIPVLVNVRAWLLYDTEPASAGHFIVITDYRKGIVYYNDPSDGKRHRMHQDDFLLAWYANALGSSAYLVVVFPNKEANRRKKLLQDVKKSEKELRAGKAKKLKSVKELRKQYAS